MHTRSLHSGFRFTPIEHIRVRYTNQDLWDSQVRAWMPGASARLVLMRHSLLPVTSEPNRSTLRACHAHPSPAHRTPFVPFQYVLTPKEDTVKTSLAYKLAQSRRPLEKRPKRWERNLFIYIPHSLKSAGFSNLPSSAKKTFVRTSTMAPSIY